MVLISTYIKISDYTKKQVIQKMLTLIFKILFSVYLFSRTFRFKITLTYIDYKSRNKKLQKLTDISFIINFDYTSILGEHPTTMYEEYVRKLHKTQTHYSRWIHVCWPGFLDTTGIIIVILYL